jgi:hypothetical protein
MAEINAPLIKGDRVSQKADYRDALPVNFLTVQRPILNANGYLISMYGLTLHGTGQGIDRGGYWNETQERHFRVSGTDLLSLSADGSPSILGVISGTDRAVMAHSFNSQAIVANNKMWRYSAGVLSEVTDTDLGDPISITWVDGYYFLTDGDFLYHTDISDETVIDPLKFSTSAFSPDPTYAVATTTDNQVIVFNRYTTEYFINQASENFAFGRISSKSIKCGCVGTHAFTELSGYYYVIGSGKNESISVHRLSAGIYQSIASREVDKILAEYNENEIKDAVIESRVQDKEQFLIVHLLNHTLQYSASIAKSLGIEYAWTILKSDIEGDTTWRAIGGVYDPRTPGWIYGDKQNANIGLLDDSVATQYGDAVECIAYSPLIKMETMSVDSIEVDTLPGHQINIDDVTCAVSLTYNGLTYGKEWWKLYGQQYNYDTRFILNRLGYVQDNIGFKIRCTSPERIALTFIKVTYG